MILFNIPICRVRGNAYTWSSHRRCPRPLGLWGLAYVREVEARSKRNKTLDKIWTVEAADWG